MEITDVTKNDLMYALRITNEQFDNNIEFNALTELEQDYRYNVTLRCKDPKGPGHSLTVPVGGWQNRLVTACWHVKRAFFHALPAYAMVNVGWTWVKVADGNFPIPRRKGFLLNQLCECEAPVNGKPRKVREIPPQAKQEEPGD